MNVNSKPFVNKKNKSSINFVEPKNYVIKVPKTLEN